MGLVGSEKHLCVLHRPPPTADRPYALAVQEPFTAFMTGDWEVGHTRLNPFRVLFGATPPCPKFWRGKFSPSGEPLIDCPALASDYVHFSCLILWKSIAVIYQSHVFQMLYH